MNKIDVFSANNSSRLDNNSSSNINRNEETIVNNLNDQVIQDSSNLSQITKETAGLEEKICRQFQMLTHNVNTGKQAMINASSSLNEISVRISDALEAGQFKINLIKMLESDKQRAEEIKAKVESITSTMVNQSELIPSLVAQLQELKRIDRAETILANSIENIHKDLEQYRQSIGDKNKQSFEFTHNDIVYVSNVTIVEAYERDLQKSPGLYRVWVTCAYESLKDVFKLWPEFKRYNEKYGMFIPTKANSTEPFLVTLDSSFLQNTTRNITAIIALEKQLAAVLNKFWSLAKSELTKSQLDCVKKYPPPFGYVEDLQENIFTDNMTQTTDISTKNNLRLLLAAGDEEYSSVLVTPNNTFAIELSGNSCGCRSFKPPRQNQGFSLLQGSVNDSEYFSLGCGRQDQQQQQRRRQQQKRPKSSSLVGNCCSKKRRYDATPTTIAQGDDDDGGDDFEYFMPGRGNQYDVGEYDNDNNDYFEMGGTGPGTATTTTPASLSNIAASALSMSGHEIQRQILQLVSTIIVRIQKTLSEVPAVADSFLSMINAVNDFDALQNLTKTILKSSQFVVKYDELKSLLESFDYNIVSNKEAGDVYKINYESLFNKLTAVLNKMTEFKPEPVPGVYILPKSLWYTVQKDVRKAYNVCEQQLTSVLLKMYSSGPKFNNRQTMGSIGVLNMDASSFFQEDSNRTLTYKINDQIEASFEKYKADMIVNQLTKKVEFLTEAKTGMDKIITNANKALPTVLTVIPILKNFRTYNKPEYMANLTQLLKNVFISRTFCERIGFVRESSLFEVWKKSYSGMDFFEFLCAMPPENVSSEKYGSATAVGCMLSLLANLRAKRASSDDTIEYYDPSDEFYTKILVPIQKFFNTLQRLEFIPFENQTLYMPGSAVAPPTGVAVELPTLGLVAKNLDDKIASYNETIKKMNDLKLWNLEKRFATPIIQIGQPVSDVFTRYGYKILLAQRGKKTIYTQGPSGTGKSFIQYGTTERSGIDAVLLEYIPNVDTTQFYDKYYLSFAFQESYEAASANPMTYYYSIENSTDPAKIVADETLIKRELLKKDYYKNQIEPTRKLQELIRWTENNAESSRAFFVATVKGREEGGIGQNITNMVDSPGFEMVPADRQVYTNPFIHLFYKVATMVEPITPVEIIKPADEEQPILKKRLEDWIKKTVDNLVTQMKIVFPECDWTPELFTTQMKSTRVPMPSGVSWERHGIIDCTFEEFINSTVLTTPYKRQLNESTVEKWSIDTGDGSFLRVYDARHGSSNLPHMFNWRASDTMHYTPSNKRYRFFEEQKQNLVLDQQFAYVIAWSYMVYKQIFKTCLGKTAAAYDRPATEFKKALKISSKNMSTYSGRVFKFINFVSTATKAYTSTTIQEDMLLTCEAVFINQFNMWATESTGKTNLVTAEKYVSGNAYLTQTNATEDNLFYEFLLLVGDNRLDSVNRTADRDRYNKLETGYEYTYNTAGSLGNALSIYNNFSKTNGSTSSSYEIFFRNMDKCANQLNKAYAIHNSVYTPYDKMNNLLTQFNSFIIKDSLNLFFYLFNSSRGDARTTAKDIQYFPFMDINMSIKSKPEQKSPVS